MATLFADSGVITIVGLIISPCRANRDAVRKRHKEQGIPFYKIILDVPVDELNKRYSKGQYASLERRIGALRLDSSIGWGVTRFLMESLKTSEQYVIMVGH